MDIYSQQHLKIAATEPEHIVRKAEFDSTVGNVFGLTTWNRSSLVSSMNEIHDRANDSTTDSPYANLPMQDVYADESVVPNNPVQGLMRNQWYDIAYSPGLDLCVACADYSGGSSPGTTMFSQNLAQWTVSSMNLPGHVTTRYDTICYSNELRMFVAASTQDAYFGYSYDGIRFQRAAAPHKGFKAVCWSPELRMFAAVAQAGQYRAAYSIDGVKWTFSDIGQTAEWKAICWSRELRKFVAVGIGGVSMYSGDGHAWTIVPQSVSGLSGNLYNVKWSKSFEKLYAVGVSGTFRGAWSVDAEHWTPILDADGLSAANEWSGLCDAGELGMTIAVARNGVNRIAYTKDGLHWTPLGVSHGVREDIQWRAITWIKEKHVFICIGYGGAAYPSVAGVSPWQVMFSFDGKNYFSGSIISTRGILNRYARHDHIHIDREKGILATLATSDKTTLVAAINELAAKVAGLEAKWNEPPV